MRRRRTIPRADDGTDRGVSDLIGFVLTFSVVILSVGILLTVGIDVLRDLQASTQTDNAESVFLAVADGFGELQEGQAPKRAGSLDLQIGASLTTANVSVMNVSVNGPGFESTVPMGSLRYEIENTTVAYESGGVFRTSGGNSALIGQPPELYCSNESGVAVVSIVTVVAPSDPSVSGGTATITGTTESTTLLFPENRSAPAIDNVTVEVSSSFEDAWDRHFEDSSTGWVDPDGDGVFTCEDVSQAFVRHTVIAVTVVA